MEEYVLYLETGDSGGDGHGRSDAFRYTLTIDAIPPGLPRFSFAGVIGKFLSEGITATGIDPTGLCDAYDDPYIPRELANRITGMLGVTFESIEDDPNSDADVYVTPVEWAAVHAELIVRGIVAGGGKASMSAAIDPPGYFIHCGGYGLYG